MAYNAYLDTTPVAAALRTAEQQMLAALTSHQTALAAPRPMSLAA